MTMTLFGWDASDFDHARGMRASHIQAAASEGIRFFTHKITEGTHVTHQQCGAKLAAARDSGIPYLGAYIVVRTSPTTAAQVDYALAALDQQVPWWRTWPGWFWQVDLEKWSYDQVAAARGPAMCAELERRGRHRALLYAPRWAYGDSIPGTDPLWASDYGSNDTGTFRSLYPGDASTRWRAYSGRTPVVLQYGSRAIIGGQQTCDANAFRGSLADFAALINAPEEDDMTKAEVLEVLAEFFDAPYTAGGLVDDDTVPAGWAKSIKRRLAYAGMTAAPKSRARFAADVWADPTGKAVLAAVAGQDVAAAVAAELAAHDQAMAQRLAGLPAALAALVPAASAAQVEAALRTVLGGVDEPR
jgi:hypothetical protein